MDYSFPSQRRFSAVHLGSCVCFYNEISHKHNYNQISFLADNKLEKYSISLWGRVVYYCLLPPMFVIMVATADDWKEQLSLSSWSEKDNFNSWTHRGVTRWSSRSSEVLLWWPSLHWGNPLAIWCQMASSIYTALIDKITYIFIFITVLNNTSTRIIININQSFVYCSQRPSRMQCNPLWRFWGLFFVLFCFLYCSSVFQGVKCSCWLQVFIFHKNGEFELRTDVKKHGYNISSQWGPFYLFNSIKPLFPTSSVPKEVPQNLSRN